MGKAIGYILGFVLVFSACQAFAQQADMNCAPKDELLQTLSETDSDPIAVMTDIRVGEKMVLYANPDGEWLILIPYEPAGVPLFCVVMFGTEYVNLR